MNFIFKSKARSPQELVRHLRDTLVRLDTSPALAASGSNGALPASALSVASTSSTVSARSSGAAVSVASSSGSGASSASSGESRRKLVEEVSKTLFSMKSILFGDGEQEPQPDQVAQLAQEVYSTDLLALLVSHIGQLEFEAKKDVAQIFNVLLRRQIGARSPTVEYVATKPDVLFLALRGYQHPDVALNTGMILREMLRHELLAHILLYSPHFYAFADYIENTTFGVSCDAFANFKECLTRHKPMVAAFLDTHYDSFFAMYTRLLESPNYVTKRQSLKLLGELLLDRANFAVMTRYIANEANLKRMMNLLRDRSRNIQFEAFHVFKVFVANPKKPAAIEAILRRNRDRLVAFLAAFHTDKDDEQFLDEKQYLLQIIDATAKPAPPAPATPASPQPA
jgi:calcium binding protein 39